MVSPDLPPVAGFLRLLSRVITVGGGPETQEVRFDRVESLRRVPATVLSERCRALLGVDVCKEPMACAVRLLYLAGSHDVVVPRWNGNAVKAAAPSAEVVTFAGPHLMLRTNPVAAAGVGVVHRQPASNLRRAYRELVWTMLLPRTHSPDEVMSLYAHFMVSETGLGLEAGTGTVCAVSPRTTRCTCRTSHSLRELRRAQVNASVRSTTRQISCVFAAVRYIHCRYQRRSRHDCKSSEMGQ